MAVLHDMRSDVADLADLADLAVLAVLDGVPASGPAAMPERMRSEVRIGW